MDKKILAGNSDTGFLKIIAIITMLADHVGYLFFPQQILWRLIGRISFPLFAYCTVLGYLHTHNLRKYFLRLFVFSFISQLPYMLCFYPESIGLFSEGEIVLESNFSFFEIKLNIGFTLLLGLWGIYGLDKNKYLQTALALLISFIPSVEYGAYGVLFMLVSYYFIFSEKAMFFCASAISLISPIFKIFISGIFDPQCFAVFAVLPIAAKTDYKIKFPKWINYGVYPAHLCILAALNFLLK